MRQKEPRSTGSRMSHLNRNIAKTKRKGVTASTSISEVEVESIQLEHGLQEPFVFGNLGYIQYIIL